MIKGSETLEEDVMGKQKDIQLLNLIAKGSETAFNQFYEMYASFVFNIARQVLGDPCEAEDVTHEVFLNIFKKPEQYNKKRGSIKAWLAVQARSRSIDRLRKKQPILVQKLELLDTKDTVETELSVLLQIEKEILLKALEKIPEKQREVIYGAYFKGKTQRELAKSLDRPLGTVKSLVRYGLRNMRKQKELINWMKIR